MMLLLKFPATLLLFAGLVDSYSIPTAGRRLLLPALHSTADDAAAFSAFADSLDGGDEPAAAETTTATATVEKEVPTTTISWKDQLDELLDPTTPLAQRQSLLNELLNANQEIRDSVLTAMRNREIDPILTPKGKQLQDGTRAVARQLTNDILPNLSSSNRPPLQSLDVLVPKLSSQFFNVMSNQIQRNVRTLQQDLADPLTRIPRRLEQQSKDLQTELSNVFLEKPRGLREPKYKVVHSTDQYEIREYERYTVASTTMQQSYSNSNSIAGTGAAFNSLAAYLFGANQDAKIMSMTTPVATTSVGEMRFYLDEYDIPLPLQEGYETGSIQIDQVPPARLAVRRFTGFVTDGEVTRQKDALLTALELDGIELDVDHGAVVPHVVFQYNPPYTLPMIRRNEIAVPVMREEEEQVDDLKSKWDDSSFGPVDEHDGQDDVSPSDG